MADVSHSDHVKSSHTSFVSSPKPHRHSLRTTPGSRCECGIEAFNTQELPASVDTAASRRIARAAMPTNLHCSLDSAHSSLSSQSSTSEMLMGRHSSPQSFVVEHAFDLCSPMSEPSSAPSSPPSLAPLQQDQESSFTSPTSNLSQFDILGCEGIEDDLCLPSYPLPAEIASHTVDRCPSSHRADTSPSDLKQSCSTGKDDRSIPTPRRSKIRHQTARDDLDVRHEPSRHVDYLSHLWKEADIWASWRYVVRRRAIHASSARLENAAWRTWTKSRCHLPAVSPTSLNWMKDHDVTWLYGPLQTGSNERLCSPSSPDAYQISRIHSFSHKKPILKKRSLSQLMLQESLSSATLIQQAAAAVQAQRARSFKSDDCSQSSSSHHSSISGLSEGSGDADTSISRALADSFSSSYGSTTSSYSSGARSPRQRRHIQFNNKVEQCIAINRSEDRFRRKKKRRGTGLYWSRSHIEDPVKRYLSSSSDDSAENDEPGEDEDDVLTMRPVTPTASPRCKTVQPCNNQVVSHTVSESNIIAMLPPTTLNGQVETPESLTGSKSFIEAKSPPFSSSQSLSVDSIPTSVPPLPSYRSGSIRHTKAAPFNFLLDDNEDDDDEVDLNWDPRFSKLGSQVSQNSLAPSNSSAERASSATRGPIDSPPSYHTQAETGYDRTSSISHCEDDYEDYNGDGSDIMRQAAPRSYESAQRLCRIASGMFLPIDQNDDGGNDDDIASDSAKNLGMFDRVIDTVNTARDIAHVLWNVGWQN